MCAMYIKILVDEGDRTVWKALSKSPASIVLMVYTFICVWFVGGLTVFHLYLIGTNQVFISLILHLCCNVMCDDFKSRVQMFIFYVMLVWFIIHSL